mgnify:CR=1 FL=1
MQMDFLIIRYFNVYLMGVNRVMSNKKWTVVQTYTAQDTYENVEAESKEEAILKLGNLFVNGEVESEHFDTETEVIEQ